MTFKEKVNQAVEAAAKKINAIEAIKARLSPAVERIKEVSGGLVAMDWDIETDKQDVNKVTFSFCLVCEMGDSEYDLFETDVRLDRPKGVDAMIEKVSTSIESQGVANFVGHMIAARDFVVNLAIQKTDKLDRKFFGDLYKAKNGQRVPDDEYIVLLAKDTAVPAALQAYKAECQRQGADERQMASLDGLIERLAKWQAAHPDRCRVADVAPDEFGALKPEAKNATAATA